MGGPLWTETEEEYFWENVIPNSDKKLGYDKDKDTVKSWARLAQQMQTAMDQRFREMGKDGAPRQYTALTLMEHWDKNVMQDRVSKAAKEYAADYVRQMPTTDPSRWERRETRLGHGASDEPKKKRQRTSGASSAAQTPSIGAKSASTIGPKTKRRRTVVEDDDDDNARDEQQNGSGPNTGSTTELPSIQHLFSGQPSGADTARRQLFPSGRTSTGNDRRFLPGPGFVDLSDNPFTPYRPAEPPAPRTGAEIAAIVEQAIDQRMVTINDLVGDDIRRVVQAELASTIGSRVREEVSHMVGALIRDEVTRVTRTLVRDEVARQLAPLHNRGQPMMGRPEIERRAAELYLPNAADVPPPARLQRQQQQQQFNPSGHGGPYTFRPPPMRPFSPLLGARATRPPVRSATRTPLPTAPRQFPTPVVPHRVRDDSSRGTLFDAEEEEEEEAGRIDDYHRA